MKIYTKTGDDGTTGLFGGTRVPKHSLRVETYGQVDELNSQLGLVRATDLDADLDSLLNEIQNSLLDLGSELAVAPEKANKVQIPRIDGGDLERLEEAIDHHEATLPPLVNFILPGGSESAARLHYARTVARRAERMVSALNQSEPLRPRVIEYLNRLSDLLFVLARVANHRAGRLDTPWVGRQRS